MDATRVPLDLPEARSGPTNAYVLGRDGSLLVDPAARDSALDAVLDGREIAHVAVTHHHPDHVGAVAAYAGEHGATVWARTGRASEFESATGLAPDRTFADGTEIPTAEGPVRVVDTPGHAPEHVAFAFQQGTGDRDGDADQDSDGGPDLDNGGTGNGTETAGRALAVGDLAVESGSVVVGAPEGDMRAYLTSLRRLHARDPAVLYPGHGPTIQEPRATLGRLIRHRLRRERRVLGAVRDGAHTPEEVVELAYEKDLTGVRDLAVATVVAHLEKQAVEGRLRWDGERAAPVD